MSVFRRGKRPTEAAEQAAPKPATSPIRPTGRVTSVIGSGIQVKGKLSGSGGVRIEGAFEGEIALDGLLVVAESGRVTCEELRAKTVVVMGVVQGNITAERVEIRRTGRVWGDVLTTSFATEEGAFLRGQIRMEEELPAAAPHDRSPEQEPQSPTPQSN